MYGEHDRDFWDLTRDIEREVERADWTRGGRALTEEVFYEPQAGVHDDEIDGGGWIGGEYVLGGSRAAAAAVAETGSAGLQGLSRREAMAKAAEERMRKQRDAGGGGGTAPL